MNSIKKWEKDVNTHFTSTKPLPRLTASPTWVRSSRGTEGADTPSPRLGIKGLACDLSWAHQLRRGRRDKNPVWQRQLRVCGVRAISTSLRTCSLSLTHLPSWWFRELPCNSFSPQSALVSFCCIQLRALIIQYWIRNVGHCSNKTSDLKCASVSCLKHGPANISFCFTEFLKRIIHKNAEVLRNDLTWTKQVCIPVSGILLKGMQISKSAEKKRLYAEMLFHTHVPVLSGSNWKSSPHSSLTGFQNLWSHLGKEKFFSQTQQCHLKLWKAFHLAIIPSVCHSFCVSLPCIFFKLLR